MIAKIPQVVVSTGIMLYLEIEKAAALLQRPFPLTSMLDGMTVATTWRNDPRCKSIVP